MIDKGGDSILKLISKVILGLLFLLVLVTIPKPHTSHAYSPIEVEDVVRNNWANNYGYKNNDMRSGLNIVYDVYSYKFTNGGYQVAYRDFGQGYQPYLNFQGWSILFGHHHHNASNQDTYIVARKISGKSGIGTTKIYKAYQLGLSATEEVEYNNKGAGLWNECPAGAYNRDNELDCNMRYDNVGFDAYLPMNELFPDQYERATWRLYLVKRVDSHIVYTPLQLPFRFDKLPYSAGKLDLTSGVNAGTLNMIGSNVIRRTAPRQTGVSGKTLGYFTPGAAYSNQVTDESGTGIWYGVYDWADGTTRWGVTAYWQFGGDQATINYIPDNRPPIADFSWNPPEVYNNTNVNLTNQCTDPDGDVLTAQWSYLSPGSSSWVNFSTSMTNVGQIFSIKGDWTIRLTCSDGQASSTIDKIIKVLNRPPVANFNFDKPKYWIGDSALITDASYDLDGDTLTYKYTITAPNSREDLQYIKDFWYYFDQVGDFVFTLEVTDTEGAKDSITKIVYANELTITGKVEHTPQWLEIHQKKGHLPHQFYSGENLVLSALITDYPANYVKATLNGHLVNGNMYSRVEILNKASNILYNGVMNGKDFVEKFPLKKGIVPIEFEVQYTNGQIRKSIVDIEVIGNVYDAYGLHRRY